MSHRLASYTKASRLEGTRPVAARDEVIAGYGASVEFSLSANGLFEYHKPLLSGAVAPTFDLLDGGRESTHGGGGASAGQRGHAPKIVLACNASACGNNAPGGGWLALPNRVGGQHSCIVARSRPMDDIATDELSRHAYGFVILEVFSATVSDCATGSATNALVPVLPGNTSPVEHCAMSVHRTNHQTYGLDRHDAGAPERRAGSFVFWCCVAAARELFVFAICGLVALAAARGRRHAAERHCYAPTTSHHRPMRVFLAFVLLCNRTVATMTVTSFTALQSANVDGATIDVTNDVTFTDWLTISGTVAITSTTGEKLSGGGSTRFFHVNGGALTLTSLTLQDGYVRMAMPSDWLQRAGGRTKGRTRISRVSEVARHDHQLTRASPTSLPAGRRRDDDDGSNGGDGGGARRHGARWHRP